MELMAIGLARPLKTLADLHALPEDVHGELLDGEVYVTPTPFYPHQAAVGELFALLRDHVCRTAGGTLCLSPLDVHLPSGDVVQPDLLWIAPGREGIVRDWVYGAPDLAVEVVSATHPERDRIVKHALYAQNGIREYWIADPASRGIEVFVLEGAAYRPAGWFTSGMRVASSVLPGLSFAVDEIFPAG